MSPKTPSSKCPAGTVTVKVPPPSYSPFLLPLPQPGGAFLEQRGDDQAVHVALPEVDVERDGHLLPVPPGKRQGVGTCEKGARSVLCEEPHGEKRSRVQHGTVQSSTV